MEYVDKYQTAVFEIARWCITIDGPNKASDGVRANSAGTTAINGDFVRKRPVSAKKKTHVRVLIQRVGRPWPPVCRANSAVFVLDGAEF